MLTEKTKKYIISLPDYIKLLAGKRQQGEKNQVLNHEKSQQIKVFLLKKIFSREKKKQWILFPIISQIGTEKGK